MPATKKTSRAQLRRDVAVLHQTSAWNVDRIVKERQVSRSFVYKWKDTELNHEAAFDDQPRSGRPKAIKGHLVQPFRRDIERDGSGNIKRVGEKYGISRRTVNRTVTRLGGSAKRNDRALVTTNRDRQKRLAFAEAHAKSNFRDWTMFDDKAFEVPPPPPHRLTAPQYRFPNSKKPTVSYAQRKQPQKLLMFVGANYRGKSQPIFNVTERTVKRRSGQLEKEYPTHTIDHVEVVRRIKKIVVPFMVSTRSKFLALDNAPCQAHSKVLEAMRRTKRIKSVGFASARLQADLRDPGGFPPNSPDCSWLDCGLFGPLETKFREAAPQSVESAMKVATRLWNEIPMKDVRKLIDGYRRRLDEIRQAGGGSSSWQRCHSVDHE